MKCVGGTKEPLALLWGERRDSMARKRVQQIPRTLRQRQVVATAADLELLSECHVAI